MIRTQVYLTKIERVAIKNIATQMGKSQSAIIRAAVDSFIENVEAIKNDPAAINQLAQHLWEVDDKREVA